MARTKVFTLIQLTWNVTDFSDEESDDLPVSSSLKVRISFLWAYITSFTSNPGPRFWGTQTPLFFHFTPIHRRWFRAANHYNCICYRCIFLLFQSWFQHFLMAQGITFYWPKKHPEIHFHLPHIDLSQTWQWFKIKLFTFCQNNLKHTTRKNCFLHKWMHKGLEKPPNNKQDPFTANSVKKILSPKHQISATRQSTQTSKGLEICLRGKD